MTNKSAYAPLIFGGPQPNSPQLADRSSLLKGVIINSIEVSSQVTNNSWIRESQPVIPATNTNAAVGSNYGDSFVFERVWVQPRYIDFGFIVEDSQEIIQIWNSFRTRNIQLTNIVAINPEGTSIEYSTLPNIFGVFGDINYPIDVYNIGPPLQDSTYRFTVDGLDYDVKLVGIRVLPFDLDPNWDAGVKVVYRFNSTIFTSKKLNEQRRPLSDDSWFNTVFHADISAQRGRKTFNTLSYGKDKVFGVPAFLEKIIPTSSTQGASAIYTDTDMTILYNLNNRTDYVILVDHSIGLAEVKKFDSIGEGVINLAQPISKPFDFRTTRVYPCIFCYLKSFSGQNITDDFDEISLDFEEYKS